MLGPSLTSIATAVVLAVVTLATNVVTARSLGVEGRGVYATVAVIATVSAGLAQMGFGQAFVFLYRKHPAHRVKRFIASAALVITIACLATGSAMILLGGTAARNYWIEILWLTPTLGLVQLVTAMSQIDNSLRPFNALRLLPSCGLLLVLIALWPTGQLHVGHIFIVQGALWTTVTFGGLYWLSRLTATRDGQDSLRVRNSLVLGLKYHATTTLGLVTGNIDKIALLIGGTLADIGLYSVAIASSRIIGLVQESVSNALFSAHAGTQSDKLTYSIMTAFRISFYPLLAVAATIALTSTYLITIVFGDSFHRAAIPFAILCFDSVVGSASWLLAQYYNATGRPGIVLIRQFLALVPVLGLLPYLPQTHSIIWLALLLLLGSLTRLAVTIFLLRRDTGLRLRAFLPDRQDINIAIERARCVLSRRRT